MWEDFWRFSGVVLFSLLVGFITQQVAACLIAGLFLYIVWQHRILKHLLVWLQKRGGRAPPELRGIIDDICREIDFMRMRHRQRKDKLSGFLGVFRNRHPRCRTRAL